MGLSGVAVLAVLTVLAVLESTEAGLVSAPARLRTQTSTQACMRKHAHAQGACANSCAHADARDLQHAACGRHMRKSVSCPQACAHMATHARARNQVIERCVCSLQSRLVFRVCRPEVVVSAVFE